MIPVHAPPRPRRAPAAPPPVAPAAPAAPGNVRERIASWCPLGWVRRILRDGQPYLNRYSLRRQGPSGHNPWRVYLHQFMAGDAPGHHNHPSRWSFSIVLWGSYTEEIHAPPLPGGRARRDPRGLVYKRRVRWFNWIAADRYHRITELHPGPGATAVWTLFVCGPLTGRGWGFLRNGVHVPIEVADSK